MLRLLLRLRFSLLLRLPSQADPYASSMTRGTSGRLFYRNRGMRSGTASSSSAWMETKAEAGHRAADIGSRMSTAGRAKFGHVSLLQEPGQAFLLIEELRPLLRNGVAVWAHSLPLLPLSDKIRSMRLFLGFLVVVAFSCEGMRAQTFPGGDEHDIRGVVAEYMAARNKNDSEAVGRLFTPDADQLVSTGEWRKGLADLVRGTSASSRKEAGKSSITVEDVRLVDSEVAIVDGHYRTVSLSGAVRDMWTTIVLKRAGHDWRITAIRNMLPAPAR